MKRAILLVLGILLLIPTVVIGLMGLRAGSDMMPVAFGVWMFFGLLPMIGAFFAFRTAINS